MVLETQKLGRTVESSGLWEAGLPGVSGARQRRSRETVAKLIAAGHSMLEDRSLDALSIEDLCAATDCTIGAFYSRFDSKESYFSAIQFVVCADRDASLATVVAAARAGKWSILRICEALVADLAAWYCANHGVLRASLLHARHGESAWSPIRELGAKHKAIWADLLATRLPKTLPARERRLRVLFAHQVVNGTLVHMLLNDPGPLTLFDPATPSRLTSVMNSYMDTKAPKRSK
jgi:AcrR family transcriptional regulator